MDRRCGVFRRIFRRRRGNGSIEAYRDAFRGHILLPKELADKAFIGACAGVQMALVRLMLGAGMTVCVFLQKRRMVMMKRRNQNRRQDYCQHQKGRYALFQ